MAAKALFIHVLVDHVDIVDGPQSYHWLKIRDSLTSNGGPHQSVEIRFKMRTGASAMTQWRKIQVTNVVISGDYTFQFTALFCGQSVSGSYNIRNRTGGFSLD